jgi:hypothetical protein
MLYYLYFTGNRIDKVVSPAPRPELMDIAGESWVLKLMPLGDLHSYQVST